MPFSIRPFRRVPVHGVVTDHVGSFLNLSPAHFSGFGSVVSGQHRLNPSIVNLFRCGRRERGTTGDKRRDQRRKQLHELCAR